MNPMWLILGRMMFWLTWPATWVYLHNSRRTRIIVMHRGQILLTKGWLSNRDWALPGGGRHRHETALKAARRELLEETGLDLPAVSFAPSGTFAGSDYGFHFTYDLFITKLPAQRPFRPQPFEITDLAWMTADEVRASGPTADLRAALGRWLD